MGRIAWPLVTVFVTSLFASCGSDPQKNAVAPEGGSGGDGVAGAPEPPVGGGGADGAGATGGEGGAAPLGCPEPTSGPTTVDADVTEPTTWTADGSPYVVEFHRTVRAALTIEPCVEVLLGPGRIITVRDEGSIEGIGTPTQPIYIGPSEAEPWGYLHTLGPPISLAYTTIEGGGELGNVEPQAEAMIEAQGSDNLAPTQEVLVFDHVTVRGSLSQGILLHDGAGFGAGSQDLIVTENATFPVAIWARALGTLPTGDYTGNGDDQIFVFGAGAGTQGVQEDTTLFNRGVPYQIGNLSGSFFGYLNIGEPEPAPVPLLTIEPGVTLRFGPGGRLYVGTRGALSAVGTLDEPITFTSAAAAPAAGDWLGVYFWDEPDPRSRLEHVVVEYAGGPSSTGGYGCPYDDGLNLDAAIRFLDKPPPGQIVTNTTIIESARHGIDRGWMGAEIDYLSNNTFQGVARCTQTFPRPDSPGVCPDPPPCPVED